MKLSVSGKQNLLNSANKVYLAYTALDFFKERKVSTPAGKLTMQELCQRALSEGKLNQTLIINGANYQLELLPDAENKNYQVKFAHALHQSGTPTIKNITEYSDSEALHLFTTQDFSLEVPELSVQPIVANRISEDYVIGGKGKMDLYRTHLVTLHHIIDKISKEEDISNLLVALATGSGKTFVQALWMLILGLSGNNGVFAVPDKLAHQFVKDLKRILPDNFVDKVDILRDKATTEVAQELMACLSQPETKGKIIVGSCERLLDKHYQDLLNANSEHTFLAFDEQHLIMKNERRRVRLIELAQQKLAMFLTATPNKETYELSGNKPVAIMSSGQKQQAGQGQFPHLITHNAKNVTDRNKLTDYRFWTADFWLNMLNGFLLRITSAIQAEYSSAGVSIVEELPFMVHEKEDEKNPRWRVQIPAARKMLCIIDDNETLVNFCNALKQCNGYRRDVYHQGNVVNREDVADFFNIPDAEVSVIRTYMYNRRDEHRQVLRAKGITSYQFQESKTLSERLKANIFHSFVEYVLTDLTGLTEIEHNRLRKDNMDAFVALVLSKYQTKTAAYYEEKLSKLLDPHGAKTISVLLEKISQTINELKNQEDKQDVHEFIDNWFLNDNLINKCDPQGSFYQQFNDYADRHVMLGIMTGMQKAETPIGESQPFAGLNEKRQGLYDGDGIMKENAKKRKHTSLEILSDTSMESTFTPHYLNISEETADNYFLLGFVGMYVSNKKTEGFSDRNLHTVVNLAENTLSTTNSPDTQIQGIGRNRGLDDTVKPTYIHSLGRDQESAFDLNHLQSNDYYPELFDAQDTYNKNYVKILGEQVSHQIIAWIHANLDKDETINPDRLKRQVLKFIALALRDINNKNSHKIKLSRAQLAEIVGYAMDDLDREMTHIENPYHLSYFLRSLGAVLNFICECYYSVIRIPTDVMIFWHSWFGNREGDNQGNKHPDDVYIKILNKTSFKSIISKMSTVMEFKNWLGRRVEGIRTHITKNVGTYLRKEIGDEFSQHQDLFLIPLLMKMVVDGKQEQVKKALQDFPQFMSYFEENVPLLQELFANQSTQVEEDILKFFQQIPGLSDLTAADIVNYPKRTASLQAMVQEGQPLKILTVYPQLKTELTTVLTAFLKNDLGKYLSAFVPYPQAKALIALLNQEDKAQAFVNHCVDNYLAGDQFSPESLIAELNAFFPESQLGSLIDAKESLQTNYLALVADSLQHLNDEKMARLISIFKDQLLPSLVNLYPLKDRAALLKNATDEKVKELIQHNAKQLIAEGNMEFGALANFLFSKLQNAPLPQQINLAEEGSNLRDFFIAEFAQLQNQSTVVSLYRWAVGYFSGSNANPVEESIAHVFQKDAFFAAISTLFPYNQWLKFKEQMKQNKQARINIARLILSMGERALQLSPEALVQLFNKELNSKFTTPFKVAETVKVDLEKEVKEISANLLQHLSPAMQDQYIALATTQLFPLLASFIKEDSKKEHFLNSPKTREDLLKFIGTNTDKLSGIVNAHGDALRGKVFALLNQLLPADQSLLIKDIVDPETHAGTQVHAMTVELQKAALTAFIGGAGFQMVIKDLLNYQDFQLVMSCISTAEQINAVVSTLMAKDNVSFDIDSLLRVIQQLNPQVKNIQLMDQRLANFQVFLTQLLQEKEKNLDKDKLGQYIADSVTPVLFHNKFISAIDEIIGFLNEEDLIVIFEALHKSNPQEEANQLLDFLDLVRDQDKEGLIKEFLTPPAGAQSVNFDNLPGKKVIDNIKELIEEVLDCHCEYHNQDRKGTQTSSTKSHLHDRLSANLKYLTVPSSYSFFSGFSRKLFYIRGITKGVDDGGEVNAASNQHILKHLQRVKTHILRPLWWSTNVSQTTHGFVKWCRDVVYGVIAGYYGFINALKSAWNWISRSDYFTISTINPDSQDYNDTAHDFADQINALDPFIAETVKEESCPTDVVVDLENYIETRSARLGFFGNLGVKSEAQDPVDSQHTVSNGLGG